jgi:cytochrome bd-type quinol oxidase subunit 2
LFEPLSLHGLTIMAVVAIVVVITSCILNYCMFRQAYKQR